MSIDSFTVHSQIIPKTRQLLTQLLYQLIKYLLDIFSVLKQ